MSDRAASPQIDPALAREAAAIAREWLDAFGGGTARIVLRGAGHQRGMSPQAWLLQQIDIGKVASPEECREWFARLEAEREQARRARQKRPRRPRLSPA